jgi:quinol monooxygenase YgiN
MVNVALALLATLAALGGAGLLIARTLPDRRIHLIAWCATLATLGFVLAGMTIGYAAGFSPALLRVLELFGSLLAPLTLALGVVELVARTVQARFAARLISASYAIVAVVIILLDPIIGTFGKSLPKVSGHYSSLPGTVLDGAHVVTVVSLVSCVTVTAVRANRRDREAAELLIGLAMVAFAGVLIVATMRSLLPGPLAPMALGGAAALVWFGIARLPGGAQGAHDDYDDDHDDLEYAEMPRRQQPYPEDPRYSAGQPDEVRRSAAPAPPMPFASPGQYGRITIYTLIDGHAEEFDRLAIEVASAVRDNEPGTIVYACHTVDNSPEQRIFYQLFRDAQAVEEHTWRSYVQAFAREARAHVTATNVIELTVSAAKAGNAPPMQPQSRQHHVPQPDGHTGPHSRPGHQPPPQQQDGRTGPRPIPQQEGHTGPRPIPQHEGHTGPRPIPQQDGWTGPRPIPQQDGHTGPRPIPQHDGHTGPRPIPRQDGHTGPQYAPRPPGPRP